MGIGALAVVLVVGSSVLVLGRRSTPRSRSEEGPHCIFAFGWFGKYQGSRLQISLSFKRRYLVPPDSSLLVVGATRSGKTRRVVLPNARYWRGTLIATSVKTDILDAQMLSCRRERGEVIVLGTSGLTNGQWWPPLDCVEVGVAMRLAAVLAHSNPISVRASPDTKFWLSLAEPVVSGALRVSARTGDALGAHLDGEPRLSQMVRIGGDISLAGEITRLERLDERQWSSIVATARSLLLPIDAVRDGTVREVSLTDLCAPSVDSLFLVADSGTQQRLAPYFSALVSALVDVRLRGDVASRDPMLILLDEAANIAPLPNLAHLASIGLGVGVTLVTVVQDLAQLSDLYGRQAGSVINNHTNRLFLGASGDPETKAYVSGLGNQPTRWPLLVDAHGRVRRLIG
jgi:type IV secretion system protein VirD4